MALHADIYGGAANIPWRGPLAANTVAGTVSGWGAAWGGKLPFARLLKTAIAYARDGFPVTHSQEENTRAKRAELQSLPGFAASFVPNGDVPRYGERHRFPALAATLQRIAEAGADDFYRGDLAHQIGKDLAQVGSPAQREDLAGQHATLQAPVSLRVSGAQLYNQAPPTQGLASLLILGTFDRIRQSGWTPDTVEGIHALVESTKQAFIVRDKHVARPKQMRATCDELLADAAVQKLAAPRWLLGRTWAEQSTTLKLESRYSADIIDRLHSMGHPVEVVADYDERMGHAGALMLHPEGWIEGGEDPRSDGAVAAW